MKNNRLVTSLLALAVLAGLFSGCAGKEASVQEADPVVASYGETEIRQSLVDYEKQNLQALNGNQAVTDREAAEQLLLNLAMLDEAEQLGLSVTQEEVDAAFAVQKQNYETNDEVRKYIDDWCEQTGVTIDDYFRAVQEQLSRVILRQKLRDALGQAYCKEHGLTFTKVNPPTEMESYVQDYLDGLLQKYSSKITYSSSLGK